LLHFVFFQIFLENKIFKKLNLFLFLKTLKKLSQRDKLYDGDEKEWQNEVDDV